MWPGGTEARSAPRGRHGSPPISTVWEAVAQGWYVDRPTGSSTQPAWRQWAEEKSASHLPRTK
ncbi:unnamed protein product, partial [Gulo gulo]